MQVLHQFKNPAGMEKISPTEEQKKCVKPHPPRTRNETGTLLSKPQCLEVDLSPPIVKITGPRSTRSSNLQMRTESGQVSSYSEMEREHLLQEFENEVY